MKFGVLAPSTNTSVQPEFDSMRPAGITNHFSRIHIPDKLVVAINTATYWWALRQNGIEDKVSGYGSLLLEH